MRLLFVTPAIGIRGLVIALLAALASTADAGTLHDPREIHLADVRQLTFGGENAEAYWSPDGSELIYQAKVPPYSCDQIFRMDPRQPGEPQLVSTGKGRTTCAYFSYPKGARVIYSSTHQEDPLCPPTPDFSQGYVWPIYSSYELYDAAVDGSDLRRLTDNQAYDAEATMCPLDGSVIFTSTRDGDLELYRMKADGSEVVRLTDTPGYDGGAFFSADCTQIVWRASRPQEGNELDEYRRLLEQGLIQPGRLELWVADADGANPRQITYLGAASFAPYFFPSGRRIIFSSNAGDPRGREFDLWAVDVDGTHLERITYTSGFDGFPVFSPDGRWLAFGSNRNQGKPGETDVYVARWLEAEGPTEPQIADRLQVAVSWLADDQRQGRGIGTEGLEASAVWLEEQFGRLGLQPAGDEGQARQRFEVPLSVEPGAGTRLVIDGQEIAAEEFRIASFSAPGTVAAEVVPVGYGISAPEEGVDHYADLAVNGRIVAVRRFTPSGPPFDKAEIERRYGDLRHKAWAAREHGAIGVVIVDLPLSAGEEELAEEFPLPKLRVDNRGDAGIPVVIATRQAAASLFTGGQKAELNVEVLRHSQPAHNIIERVVAGGEPLAGTVVIGAHYDHLGLGESGGSLSPEEQLPHNGADDNASGTAALLEIARVLQARRGELRRDVVLVAFAGEESGLLGSTHLTRNPPPGLDLGEIYAMLNLDMVGRLRRNKLSVLGGDSAEEWAELVEPACERVAVDCNLSGDGYGPSDQTPFYAAGIPVLHFFTGSHDEYHKPSDDTELLNFAGLAQVSRLVADLGVALAQRDAPLTLKEAPPLEPRGDARSYGASLGTIPDYAGDDRPGVLLAGTRPGGPADAAGIKRGDLLVELAGREVRDIYDFMYVLRQGKPGETVSVVVDRDGERVELEVTFGKSRGMQ